METPKQSQRNEKMAHNVWSKAPQQKKYHGKGEGKGLPSKKQRKYVTDHDLKREIKRKMEANVTKASMMLDCTHRWHKFFTLTFLFSYGHPNLKQGVR